LQQYRPEAAIWLAWNHGRYWGDEPTVRYGTQSPDRCRRSPGASGLAAPAANRLVLNAVDLTIEKASIDGDTLPSTALVLDHAAETLTLSLSHAISVGRHQLSLTYEGRINRFGRGLFMVDYPTAAGRRRMISSHLEPSACTPTGAPGSTAVAARMLP
jgi:hypothetical protein